MGKKPKVNKEPVVIYVKGEFDEKAYKRGIELLSELMDEMQLLKQEEESKEQTEKEEK